MPPPSTSTSSSATSSSPQQPLRPPRKLATAAAVLSTMQIVLALTVAAVVQLRLRTSGTCLLGAGGNGVIVGGNVVGNGSDNPSSAPIFSSRSSSCSFAYTAAAASIFASFALSLARCAGVKAGLWLEGSLSAALAGWWVVAAVVFSFDASRANAIGWVVGVERVVWEVGKARRKEIEKQEENKTHFFRFQKKKKKTPKGSPRAGREGRSSPSRGSRPRSSWRWPSCTPG